MGAFAPVLLAAGAGYALKKSAGKKPRSGLRDVGAVPTDDAIMKLQRRRRAAAELGLRGRASTILSDYSQQRLGA